MLNRDAQLNKGYVNLLKVLKPITNSSTIKNESKLIIDQRFLTYCLQLVNRQMELEQKQYTTLEEDYELSLLRDPATSAYAKRMVELEFKDDKSPAEKKELDLLKEPTTREYANRILELDQIQNKTYIEDIEADVLANPQFRSFYREFIPLAQKLMNQDLNSDQERRAAFLFLNKYSIKQAKEIMKLENLSELTDKQVAKLAKDYLLRICEVPQKLSTQVDEDSKNAAQNQTYNCITINKKIQPCKKEIIKYDSVKKAIDEAAKGLVEKYYKQVLSAKSVSTLFKSADYLQRMLNSDQVQDLIQKKQALLALVLKKIFFDFDCGFSKPTLDTLTDHLSNQITHKNLEFSTSDFKKLFSMVQDSLNHIELPEENSVRNRHGW